MKYIEKVKYWRHPSGTNCVFVYKDNSPLISIDIWCKAGISFEKKGEEGIAHLLEHMIFKGSNKLNPGEFDLKIESLGGSSNASTGYDDAHYYVLIPTNNFKESLSLLTNLVLIPKFNSNEFNLEKSVVIEEILQSNDQIDERIFNYFLKKVWIDHFYSKSILGKVEDIKSIKISKLKNFHKSQYTSKNTCIAIAGNLPSDLIKILRDCEINFATKSKGEYKVPNHKKLIKNAREIVFFEKLEFGRIYMAWQIPKDQKYLIGFEILASILSNGRNSRLIRSLKEEENIVESIYCDTSIGEFGGLFILEASCNNENLNIVEEKINKIIQNLIEEENLLIKDIRKTVKILKRDYVFNLQTVSQLTSYYGSHLLWGRKNQFKNLEDYLNFWSKISNFKLIINYLLKEKFTLLVKKINHE
tara:strand:+ start:827 stop:2074 length:1248 start_codon:yes stop_codon:yes gene_type:complete